MPVDRIVEKYIHVPVEKKVEVKVPYETIVEKRVPYEVKVPYEK